MQFLLSVLVTVLASRVESVCDHDIVTKINSIWGEVKTEGVLDQLVGSMSYLYIPKMLDNILMGIRCIKTILNEGDYEAEDYHLYDEEDARSMEYQMIADQFNITRSFTSVHDDTDDYVFPIYLKHGVFGFWQCREDYDSFINIGVINFFTRQELPEVKEAIAEAKTELLKLGLDFPETKGRC